MADINELVKKYVPKNDVPVIGEDVFWDEKNNAVVVKNAYGTSIYNPDGNLLYGKGALYDTNIGSVSGKSVQLFGRNDEIAAEASGDEAAIERIRNERLAREGAYSTGGIKGLVSYLNTDGVPSTTTTGIQNSGGNASVVSTYTDPTTGDVTAVLSNGTTRVLAKSGKQEAERKSAYDLLYQQFNDLGIGGLVPELKSFIEEGISPAEFTLRLRQTDSYKKRFAANAQRIGKGLRALSEAEYIGLEDQYQNVMRQYGLPESYYTRGEMGRQEGFEKFIAGDVSAAELEDRISTAQKRVINANPEVAQALKTFYPGISNGDILAYTLDPTKAIEDIKRKVSAAEIGGSAARFGLTTNVSDAEYLRNYGVTKEQAEQGYSTIAGGLQRGSQLASMYGENPYTQATAEQEVFNVPGAAEARKQRQKLTGLEKATFGGQSGLTSGALMRDRAGGY
jgi:hypothetical protein